MDRSLTQLYLTEVVSVWAFGLSWLLTARALLARLIPRVKSPLPTAPSEAATPATEPSVPPAAAVH